MNFNLHELFKIAIAFCLLTISYQIFSCNSIKPKKSLSKNTQAYDSKFFDSIQTISNDYIYYEIGCSPKYCGISKKIYCYWTKDSNSYLIYKDLEKKRIFENTYQGFDIFEEKSFLYNNIKQLVLESNYYDSINEPNPYLLARKFEILKIKFKNDAHTLKLSNTDIDASICY